jgi:sugar/nucleoside kinase (ribokinase family)
MIAEMTQKAHQVMRSLGLDVGDTTGHELYAALISAAKHGHAEDLLRDTGFVLMPIDGQVVSFNFFDVVDNAHHELHYGDQIVNYGRRTLRGELFGRYIDHPRTHDEAVRGIAISIGFSPEEDLPHLEIHKKHSAEVGSKPYVLAVGDIVTDAFIQLLEDQAEVYKDEDGNERISMEFGSKPPYDHVDVIDAVGNSANAAVAFSRLGLDAGLMAFIGDDKTGEDALGYLKQQRVDTSMVSVKKDTKTNYHYVLRYGADRTILIKYEDYDYKWQEPKRKPDWIYLSMLSEASWQLHEDMTDYLEKHKDIKLIFQPGTFHFKWGVHKLERIYKRSYLVVMNREEAALVVGKKSSEKISVLAEALHKLGPEIAVITDGPKGAYVSDGQKILKVPNYPDPAPPYDRTGAGDAFASTLVAGLALGEPIEKAMLWAPINSMNVVQKLGAQAGLLTKAKIEKYLQEAPKDFKTEEIEE